MVELQSFFRKMSQYFYAVGVGRQVGVYTSWPECQKQIINIANARYRKFKTHKEAVSFIQECKEKFSPYKSPSKLLSSRSNLSSSQPSCSSWEAGTSSTHSFVSSTQSNGNNELDRPTEAWNFLTQPSKNLVMSLEVGNNSKQVEATSTSLDSARLSPETQLAMARLSDEDPFADEAIHNSVLRNCTESSVVKEFCKKVEHYFLDLKTTLGHMMVKLHDLDTKVESLTNMFVDYSQRGNNDSLIRSSVKRDLLSSYNVPQPIGKRQKRCTAVADNEIEVVPMPPKKIPKIELHSDDEVDGFDYDFKVNEDGFVIVYTDGACEKNGRHGAKAGIGVWFGDSHPLNCSEPVRGRATNNNAEIQAAVQALEVAKRAGVKKVLVHTDSEFLINCITKWVKKWQKNGWKAATGEAVKNKEELILLMDTLEGIEVKWEHVRGHQGIHGNEMADSLARDGAKRYKT